MAHGRLLAPHDIGARLANLTVPTIASTPSVSAESSPTGFNVGGGLDYRFGRSGLFGLGIQLLYSTGDAELQATPEAEQVSFKAGGLQVAAGIRVYF